MTVIDRRPDMEPPFDELYDWLALNGVDEWLPEGPTFTIKDGALTYTAYVWNGPRGWSGERIVVDGKGKAAVEQRTVPMVVPPTPRIRELLARTGATLEVRG